MIGLLPAAFTLVIRAWVPESPHWLMSQGRKEEARKALAWALRVQPETLPLPDHAPKQEVAAWSELFKYPKSVAVSWMASIGATFFVCMAGVLHNEVIGGISMLWLMIVIGDFFYDGGFAVIGPYMAEVWPTRLRTTGMGSAYGFGGIGKVIGPLGLALIVGTSDFVSPKATLDAILPAFTYFTAWLALCGCAFLFFGFETGKQSIAAIDEKLGESEIVDAVPATTGARK